MNKFHLIRLIILSVCLNTTLLKAQLNKYQSSILYSPKQKSEFILYLAKNYSTNAFSILNRKTYDYYIKWAYGKSHYRVLSSYAVVVHETCHLINYDIGGFWSKGYFISPSIDIKVSMEKVFKSNELDKIIPRDWKSNIFRYHTYVHGDEDDKEIASVSEGIYGLMDEFDAYYQSTKALIELYPYYKSIASNTEPYYWTLYLSNCYSTIYAYYEFRIFIAWYLKYARKNHPEIYLSIIQNKELRAVFTLIDNGFEKVTEHYFENRKLILDNINKAGRKKVEISDKYFIVQTKTANESTSVGYGIPDSEILYIKSIFTAEDYKMLKLFRIDGLNEANYKAFL